MDRLHTEESAKLGDLSERLQPFRHEIYGIPDAPRYPFQWDFTEKHPKYPKPTNRTPNFYHLFPGTKHSGCRRRVFQAFPVLVHQDAFMENQQTGQPAVHFLHPSMGSRP